MSPDDIEAARRLVAASKTATLSTLANRRDDEPPYPFGSLVAVATDPHGVPLLLLSALAEHTKNLLACPRGSLLFAESTATDPLASARVTLLGDVVLVPEAELATARERYLAVHPGAGAWSTFKDFAFYTLHITEIRMVAGFGKMGWIAPDAYLRP